MAIQAISIWCFCQKEQFYCLNWVLNPRFLVCFGGFCTGPVISACVAVYVDVTGCRCPTEGMNYQCLNGVHHLSISRDDCH